MQDNRKFYVYAGHSDPPHSSWKFILDTPEEREKALKDARTAISSMSFSHEPEKGKSESHRRGPLLLDFDCKLHGSKFSAEQCHEEIIKKIYLEKPNHE